MPIRREYRWLYPIDWPQLTDVIRFERAGGRCERCGRPHGVLVAQLADGRWWDGERGYWRTGRGRRARRLPPPDPALFTTETAVIPPSDSDPGPLFAAPVVPKPGRRHVRRPAEPLRAGVRLVRVTLSTAHLDHDPANNRAKNLKALCQICHLQHDRPEHQRRRLETLKARKAIGDLFQGPYGFFS